MADPGTGLFDSTQVTGSNPISVAIPAGASVGDRLIVAVMAQGVDLSSGPADCNLLATFGQTSSGGDGWIWEAVVGDTANLDPGDMLTVTMTGNGNLAMGVAAYPASDIQDFQADAGWNTTASSPPYLVPSPGATALDDARAVHIYGIVSHNNTEIPTWTADAATVEQVDVQSTNGSQRNGTLLIADESVLAGSVPSRTADASFRVQRQAATIVLATAVLRPVATASTPTPTVSLGTTGLQLNGAAVDGGGAGAPYTFLWEPVSGPDTPTFSDATAQNPTITSALLAGTYVIGLKATDSGSVESLQDTVSVVVVGAGAVARPISDVTVANWTTQPPGAPNVAGVIGDNNDGTYAIWTGVFGPFDTLEVDLSDWTPTPGLGGSMGLRVRCIGAEGSAVLQLREGASTVIATGAQQDWDQPGEIVQFDLAFDAAAVASISDPNNLRLRLTGELSDPGA